MNAQAELLLVDTPEQQLLNQLQSLLKDYLTTDDLDDVLHAYQFGEQYHLGQFRKSGEAYICHPLSVAVILAQMQMDVHGIMAAILHDVVEDTDATIDEIQTLFGDDVALLVDGVTKLTQLNCKTKAEAQAENIRKMCLAMAKDLRVIMVKLADRLHNMQTLGVMRPEKKYRIAKETLEIYAPIANRLGMNSIRHQLETLSFKAMYPLRHDILLAHIKKARGHRKEIVETISSALENRLDQMEIASSVNGREKFLYSIYKKMRNKKLPFSDIFDVYAFRIYCEDVNSCYRILGVVHNLYKPVPGKFKDYIAIPKANGYQSLHTVLIGPYGVPIEIQIRTHKMHRLSESGIAAHWLYKSDHEGQTTPKNHATEWIRDLLELQKTSGDSLEFIDNLKVDLFPQEVFVFTPQGKIIALPRNASIIDFAYAVHTDIGNSCFSGKVDKQFVPLPTKLDNGVTVEVSTANWAKPSPVWLNYAVTTKARSGIRYYLKHFKQQEAINLGRNLLNRELLAMKLRLKDISDELLQQLLDTLNIASVDALYEEIGLGNKMPFLIAKQLNKDDMGSAIKLDTSENQVKTPLIIKGTEGIMINLAKCCHPIPDDTIIGYFHPGRGISIHRPECHNSLDERKNSSDWLEVEWGDDLEGEYVTAIRLEILNQPGTLAMIASTISTLDSNIEHITIADQDARISIDHITFSVKNRVHLATIMRELKKLPITLKITRIKG
ncbi:MAG: RelA/SpoT family protein [Methyloprofundus sp.]|nr:RelA/SpoT family protein [Methyloprofundus sp.]